IDKLEPFQVDGAGDGPIALGGLGLAAILLVRAGVDDLELLVLEALEKLLLGGQAAGMGRCDGNVDSVLTQVFGDGAAAGFPGRPAAVEEAHVPAPPVAENPPDAGCVLDAVIVDDDASLRCNRQPIETIGPGSLVFAVGKRFHPGVVVDPDGARDVA